MIKPLYILAVLILFLTSSCKEQLRESETESRLEKIAVVPIDYKSDRYHIHLGDHVSLSKAFIDWHWAAEADQDGMLDSLQGTNALICLEEPTLHYNNAAYLPSLHTTTKRNRIISFTCSVLFELEDKPGAEKDFFILLSKDIKSLQQAEVLQALATKGFYQRSAATYTETFKLLKKEGGGYDNFEYTVCYNNKK